MSKRNPFDFVKSVSYDKKDIMVDAVEEKAYAPFLINKSLSYHQDSLFMTNEMNNRSHLEHRLQYVFLLNTLRTRQRYTPWLKAKKEKHLESVKEYYGYSNEKAKSALNILNDEQINTIMDRLNKGGRNGK